MKHTRPIFDEEPAIKITRCGNSSICSQRNGKIMPASENNQNNSNQTGGNANGPNSADNSVDTNLYSRQIYALGESAMTHLRKASVLISGIGSVGLEIAKNVILGGVRHVTLHDQKLLTFGDLSACFYADESMVGENRAKIAFTKLAELNDTVTCVLHTEALNEEFVKQFDLVIVTDSPWEEQIKINNWMRKHGKLFISADARGLFSYAFVDLGEKFAVHDVDGETYNEVLLEHVNCETGEIFTLDKAYHGLEDGDHIVFEDFEIAELNKLTPTPVKTTAKGHIINVGKALSVFSSVIDGPISRGRARKVKMPKFIEFKSLADALKLPEFMIWDFAKFDGPEHLHRLWQALYKFEKKHKRSPKPRSKKDAELFKAELEGTGTAEIPEQLLLNFSYQATGNLQPVASVIGGFVAQEAFKAVTHHTTPLKQFLYTDSCEALPGDYSSFDAGKLTEKDCEPRQTRYDGQAAVFGWSFQAALSKQNWFIVGAGAIGCELFKNMAMMGLAAGNGGLLKVTDPDTIEVSNLNRQFLFRRPDVGKKKSEVAARSMKQFNPAVNVQALSDIVSEATESVFNDDFFNQLNGVCNALDNVEARRYVDRRCVYYQLPLLESGTMGAKGNTQVVFPHLTESYGSTSDPPESETPVCTLKNFPYQIQHTIQWARSKFADHFTSVAETANQYLDDVNGFLGRLQQMTVSQKIELLRALNKALIDECPSSAEDCVKWARDLFDSLYRNEIMQLLHNFPPDQVTSQGQKFWSGTKRCPHPLNFDVDNPEHLEFVYSAAFLRAQLYNIEPISDPIKVAHLARAIISPEFKPREGIKIAITDAEAAANDEAGPEGDDSEKLLDTLNMNLARLKIDTIRRLTPIDFEKDDDTNHHIDFITAASNLRAENYTIEKADRMKTKQIAGKIIPALATTTSVVAGLVCIELYKTIEVEGQRSKAPIERFKNAFLNLATPFIAFSEPGKAAKKKYRDIEFTLWDRLEVNGPKTLGQFIEWIETQTGLTVSMMSSGVSLLYAFFQPPGKVAERKTRDVIQVVEEVSRNKVPPFRRSLVFEAITQNDKDEDVEIPYVKYNFR
uniref:E1 ubiquitin-activating enzyme n=1 Tax=Meloidogyne enterolobii TaxID=390850 RepID=A0A6V7TL36_MELEN|nr:unnamed protein product [Meloidogyne enterolobii]